MPHIRKVLPKVAQNYSLPVHFLVHDNPGVKENFDNYIDKMHMKAKKWRSVDRASRAEDPAYEAKMRAQLPTSKCCLCGEAFQGYLYGHNAHPMRDEGVACDACNGAIVLPQRFRKWAP